MPTKPSPQFRDAADLPAASCVPDIESELAPLECALELIGKQAVQLPPHVSRQWFSRAAAALFIEVLREAQQMGRLADLFDGIDPSRANHEMTARLLAELIDADNPRLQAKCMAFVLELTSESQTAIARQEKVGKAAVSKRCIRICETLGLPPSRGMKKEAARLAYSKRQRGKRARPLREPWAFAGILKEVYAGG